MRVRSRISRLSTISFGCLDRNPKRDDLTGLDGLPTMGESWRLRSVVCSSEMLLSSDRRTGGDEGTAESILGVA